MTIDHQAIFHEAFANPKNTAISFKPQDVNKILYERYSVDKPITYSLTQMWDMEVRKAAQPDKYLPQVVRPGSLEKFPSTKYGNVETFVRVADQRRWKDREQWATVIENVQLDHDAKTAFFVGLDEFVTPDGRTLVATRDQPKFHVEHSAVGSEERPVNEWRIVFLTGSKDEELASILVHLGQVPYLREFHEIYLEQDLGVKLERK